MSNVQVTYENWLWKYKTNFVKATLNKVEIWQWSELIETSEWIYSLYTIYLEEWEDDEKNLEFKWTKLFKDKDKKEREKLIINLLEESYKESSKIWFSKSRWFADISVIFQEKIWNFDIDNEEDWLELDSFDDEDEINKDRNIWNLNKNWNEIIIVHWEALYDDYSDEEINKLVKKISKDKYEIVLKDLSYLLKKEDLNEEQIEFLNWWMYKDKNWTFMNKWKIQKFMNKKNSLKEVKLVFHWNWDYDYKEEERNQERTFSFELDDWFVFLALDEVIFDWKSYEFRTILWEYQSN